MDIREELKKKYPNTKIFVVKRNVGTDRFAFYFPIVTSRDIKFGGTFGQEIAIKAINDLIMLMYGSGENELDDDTIWRTVLNVPLMITKNGEKVAFDSIPKKFFVSAVEDWTTKMGIFTTLFDIDNIEDDSKGQITEVRLFWGGFLYVVKLPYMDMDYINNNISDTKVAGINEVLAYWADGIDVYEDENVVKNVGKEILNAVISVSKSFDGIKFEEDDDPDLYMLVAVVDQLVNRMGFFKVEYEII